MTQDQLNQAVAAGKTQTLPPQGAPQSAPTAPSTPPLDLSQFLTVLSALNKPKQPLTAAPTLVPKNEEQQIQFYDNKLYLYIGGQWIAFGGGGNYASGQGSQTTTGTKSITGLSFTPKLIKITAFMNNGSASWSWGTSTGPSNNQALEWKEYAGLYLTASDLISLDNASGAIVADLQSFDSAGFTLNFATLTSGDTCHYQWEAYG
jgi:hypothetical protein